MVCNRVVFLLFEVRQLQVLDMIDLYCKFEDPIQKSLSINLTHPLTNTKPLFLSLLNVGHV